MTGYGSNRTTHSVWEPLNTIARHDTHSNGKGCGALRWPGDQWFNPVVRTNIAATSRRPDAPYYWGASVTPVRRYPGGVERLGATRKLAKQAVVFSCATG